MTTAYWIAFGPHGPRREVPPGEGFRIFRGIILLVGLSGAIFYTTRLFAGPPPKTMSKEWEERTNEFMKVRQHGENRASTCFLRTRASAMQDLRTLTTATEEQDGANHRYFVRRLQGHRSSTITSHRPRTRGCRGGRRRVDETTRAARALRPFQSLLARFEYVPVGKAGCIISFVPRILVL